MQPARATNIETYPRLEREPAFAGLFFYNWFYIFHVVSLRRGYVFIIQSLVFLSKNWMVRVDEEVVRDRDELGKLGEVN